MSGRQYPSIGFAFYMLMRLKNFLQQHERKENAMMKRLKQLLLAKFIYYFENDNEQNQLLKVNEYYTTSVDRSLSNIVRYAFLSS